MSGRGVGNDTGRGEIDEEGARVRGRELGCQESVFEGRNGAVPRSLLQCIWAFRNRFVEHGQHFSFFLIVCRKSRRKMCLCEKGLWK